MELPLSTAAAHVRLNQEEPGDEEYKCNLRGGGARISLPSPSLLEATGVGHNVCDLERLRNRHQAVEPRLRCLAKIYPPCRLTPRGTSPLFITSVAHNGPKECSRTDTREFKDKLCWHSSFAQGARGRTREMLKASGFALPLPPPT